MAFKLYLQLFLLLPFIAPHVITAAYHLHIHKSPRLLFHKHLEESRKGDNIKGIHSVKAYLQRYGYLRKNITNNSHADTFDDLLESAVKSYQKFFKLNVSGILDKDTLAQMANPRCGVTDNFLNNNERNHIGDSHFTFFPKNRKWPKFHLTYGFIHNYPAEHIAPVVRAFDTWSANTKFTFSQASRTQSSEIIISFERGDHGDSYSFDGAGGILAHSFGAIDGRVHFEADEPWKEGNAFERYDLESVALHELGHSLGLGHSAIEAAVMWPDLDSGVTRNNLHPDDIAGILSLYP